MKITGFVCLLIALYKIDIVVARSIQEDPSALTNEEEICVDELHLNKNEIQVINNRDLAPEDNENFDNFLSCYWKKMNWQMADGTINYDILKADIFEAIISEVGDDADDLVKLMLLNLLQTTILTCKNNMSNNVPNVSISKLQNCIIKDFENLTGYSN